MFIRLYLDHGDFLHDQAYNFAFHQKLESFQYNASLAIKVTTGEYPEKNSAENVSNYGVFSGPHFPAFGLNTEYSPNEEKYRPERTPYSHTLHAV